MIAETARPFIDVADPVAKALADGRPVVALESTIITHGMPYPETPGWRRLSSGSSPTKARRRRRSRLWTAA